jgi:hypothetical protein
MTLPLEELGRILRTAWRLYLQTIFSVRKMTTMPHIGLMAALGSLMFSAQGADFADAPYRGVKAWSVTAKFVRLGTDPNAPPKFMVYNADWTRVNAPVSVVRAAKEILVGDPKTWTVHKIRNYDDTGQETVVLDDRENGRLIFLAGKRRWIRLNERHSLPVINKILKASARARKETIYYAESLMYLYKGPERMVLSEKLWGVIASESDQWLGRDRNIRHLERWHHDPTITRDGKRRVIAFNAIDNWGSIEKWTLFGRKDNGMIIEKMTVEIIRPRRTFSYPIIDS